MRLRSFSLSKIIPIEILNLIILESSDSTSSLLSFCLVSLGCLSIAGPLLNEHVHLSRRDDFPRVLERITLAENDQDERHLLLHHLPRLASPLSLKILRSLTLRVQPDLKALARFSEEMTFSQPRRSSLIVHLPQSLDDDEDLRAIAVLVPQIVRLLRPGTLTGVQLLHDGDPMPYLLKAYPFQVYSNIICSIPLTTSDAIALLLIDPPFLDLVCDAFEVAVRLLSARDKITGVTDILRGFSYGMNAEGTLLLEDFSSAWDELCREEEVAKEESERDQDGREGERSLVEAELALDDARNWMKVIYAKYSAVVINAIELLGKLPPGPEGEVNVEETASVVLENNSTL